VRLLLDVSAVPTRPVGAGVYTLELARGLAQRDEVDLHLLARTGDRERWCLLAPRARVHDAVPTARPARLLWEQLKAPRVARELAVDVWHGPHYTLPVRLDVPAVVTVHDLTFFEHPEWHERTKVAFFRRMIRSATARAAAIVAVSEHTRDRLAAVIGPTAPVFVARHGVERARFTPEGSHDLERLDTVGIRPPYLAFAATLEPRKDVPTLIAAFARIAPAHPELRLVVAGRDGWGAVAIRDAAATSGCTTRIARIGWIDDDLLPAFFRHAELVAYPSLEEGFGLPALEALSCGAPLVTTTGSAMQEVVGDAAALVPPGDPGRLAEAMEALLVDHAARARLRRAGPIRAAEFAWSATVDQHLAAYRAAWGEHMGDHRGREAGADL